ncbi:putative T7SS-secreted protein [Buchananella hordeovulneris]|uniref:Putative T7SS secretion signal domain-containing protein n=1 Tax=Buchananella hordeovulneris TaxID=52770 RepID=A0A1Q5PTZ6_9ACTO|nr:hypothetical protein [Buchananella hordeovulneris]OKL51061.1 hypothetical protein BSZ40_09140 [Buchananella hordeovulneris]RRD43282.1 hypothetical protein EII13_07230 [Buchananella hordeovulneris]RRD52065.1 hypothetical protein EII12_06170 [Buchananella hordeovulneris]
MTISHRGAPDFVIEGNLEALDQSVTALSERATNYETIATSLGSIRAEGWKGRAADRFRERFDLEPDRWQKAADGFRQASDALSTFRTKLSEAKNIALQCREDYAAAQTETEYARKAYDADVEEGYRRKAEWEATNGPGTFTLTIVPFTDPGQPKREQAETKFTQAVTVLTEQANTAAQAVREACTHAPAQRSWWGEAAAAVGEFFGGAAEAVIGLLTMPGTPISIIGELWKLGTGELTLEEAAAKFSLGIEDAQAAFNAMTSNPGEFFKAMGKAILDWDTWADNPARAAGKLLPDAIVAVATAGSGAAATRGATGLQRLTSKADDLTDVVRVADDLGDIRKADRAEPPKTPQSSPNQSLPASPRHKRTEDGPDDSTPDDRIKEITDTADSGRTKVSSRKEKETTQYFLEGGDLEAKAAFERIVGDAKQVPKPVTGFDLVTSELPDGTKVVYRSYSSQGSPTVEIQYPRIKDPLTGEESQQITKLRFEEGN